MRTVFARITRDPDRWVARLMAFGLLAIATVTISLTALVVQIQAATTAYAGAESIWSRAQSSTVLNLLIYSETGDRAYYDKAMEWHTVNIGDKQARQAMEGQSFTASQQEQARAGFLVGRNHPDDVSRMIWLFRWFQNAPYFRDAVSVWQQTDPGILRLEELATRIAHYHGDGELPPELNPVDSRDQWQAEVIQVNQQLAELATTFRHITGNASRQLASGLIFFAAIFLLVAGSLTVFLSKRLNEALTRSRRRYQAMIEQANAGIARVASDGYILEANDALCQTLKRDRDSLKKTRYKELVHPEDWRDSIERLRAFERGEIDELEMEQRFRRGDGEYIWACINITKFELRNEKDIERVVIFEDVTQRRALHERLDFEASHDELTGLHNRRALRDEIQKVSDNAYRDNTTHALCFIDLDKFKVVNDTVGHEAGDRLLVAITRELRQSLRQDDFIARLGGDEFAVIFRSCDLDTAKALAEKVRQALDGYPFRWDNHEFEISCSVGLAPITRASHRGDEVLRNADRACYIAKEHGRNAVHVVDNNDDTHTPT